MRRSLLLPLEGGSFLLTRFESGLHYTYTTTIESVKVHEMASTCERLGHGISQHVHVVKKAPATSLRQLCVWGNK
jgi:hypothetical protein